MHKSYWRSKSFWANQHYFFLKASNNLLFFLSYICRFFIVLFNQQVFYLRYRFGKNSEKAAEYDKEKEKVIAGLQKEIMLVAQNDLLRQYDLCIQII